MRLIISNDIMKKDYPLLGAVGMSKKYGKKPKYFINRAYILKIKFNKKIKLKKYCKKCGKEVNKYQKSILCHSCSAKRIYNQRGKFSHNNSRLWINEEIEFLVNNYYDMEKNLIIDNLKRNWSSIMHKANRLNLKRNWSSIMHKANRLNLKRNEKFIKKGNIKGREYFKKNNPMKNQIFKEKALKKQALIFSKTSMTSIEKKVAKFLDNLGISYQFNKYIKTKDSFRFPDFTIGNLIIECDGEYWHRNRKQEDYERQLELEDVGYRIIRFTDKEILNNWGFVKQCILLELSL